MKKIISILLSFILAVFSPAMTVMARPDWPADTGIESEAGIVVDVDSGTVLYGQNIRVKKSPASITKVLTALVAIENGNLDDTVTFTADAMNNVESDSGNKNNMAEGDQMTLRDALYFMLLTSSNQAANAIAEHVGGSQEEFIAMMNQRAEELGCVDSHFVNPSGLYDEEQMTTVYDMALIGIAAYSNPVMLEISQTKNCRMPATANNPEGFSIYQEHRMLDPSREEYYVYALAGKTGYTELSGQTLITYAVKENRRLVAVTMKSTQFTHYKDTTALLNFGFNSFHNLNIAENEAAYISGETPVEIGGTEYAPSDLSIDPEAVITVPENASFGDAEKEVVTDFSEDHPDGAAARLEYTYNDRRIGSVWLVSASKAQQEQADAEAATAVSSEESGASETGDAEPPDGNKRGLGISGGQILLGAGLVLSAVLIGSGVFLLKRKRDADRRMMEERRMRRRERLKEIGCTQEEFERMLEERTRRQDRPQRDRREE